MRRSSLMLYFAIAAPLSAQDRIPIRTIGPILATSTESVGPAVTVRGTSDGHVIVAAAARHRVYAFDSTLQVITMVVDSGAGTGVTAFRTTGLIPYMGDSTLLPDFGATALVVLDSHAKQVRSIAPPHASDLRFIGVPSAFGHPSFDATGRLVYRSVLTVNSKTQPDTSPLVRGDFDTRSVDTLAWLKTSQQGGLELVRTENPTGGPPIMELKMLLNPFPTSDEWAMLSDGTIAIVRVHDYHIDWIDPDGSRRSSVKMAFDWRRLTDAEKQQRIDSAKHAMEESFKPSSGSGRSGAQQTKLTITIVADSELPSFWPPIQSGSVLADLDDHLWILPTTSMSAASGFTYDLVNRNGQVLERVQLPKGHVLVGFGAHNVVYLTRADGTTTYLERALLTGPPK